MALGDNIKRDKLIPNQKTTVEDSTTSTNSNSNVNSSELYEIFNGFANAVVMFDRIGKITFFNPSAEKLWGKRRHEAIGKDIKELMYDSSRNNYADFLIGLSKDDHALQIDEVIATSVGQLPVSISMSSTSNQLYALFARDISKERHAEEELKEQIKEAQASEEELRQNMEELYATQEKQAKLNQELERSRAEFEAQFKAIDNSYAFIEFDPKGNVIDANNNFLQTLGYNLSEIKGKSHNMFVDSGFANSTEYKNFWNELTSGNTVSDTFKRITKSGNEVWLDASYAPVMDENGQVVKIVKLARDVTDFKVALKATSVFLNEIMGGNFNAYFDLKNIKVEGEIEEMVRANISLRETLKAILQEIKRVVNLAGASGQLSERFKDQNYGGIWKDLVDSLNGLLDNISEPIFEINKVVSSLSMGDLTTRFEKEAQGDIADMANALNIAIGNISSLLENVQTNAAEVDDYSGEMKQKSESMKSRTAEMSSAIAEISQGAQEQVNRTDESSKLVDNIFKSADDISRRAEIITSTAEKGQQSCTNGIQIIKNVVSNMTEISQSANITSQSIEVLTDRSEEISKTLRVITDIAFQTNLLALNAAIEAARAGDAGRGFEVVAEEIRKLAEESKRSADNIEDVIKNVQKDTDAAIKAIEAMKGNVQMGMVSTNEAETVFEEISRSSSDTLDLSKQVLKVTQEQKNSVDFVVKNIEKIVVVSEETASGTNSISSSSTELSKSMDDIADTGKSLATIAKTLKESIGRFKLEK